MSATVGSELLNTISAIATLITPILLLFLGGIGWLIQNRLENSQIKQEAQFKRIYELEDLMREDRLKTYNLLLEPFFLLFTSESAFSQDKKYKNKDKNELAIERMLSVEYRQVGFKLSLIASDEVVRSYNNLMQFFYHNEDDLRPIEEKTSQWIALMAALLLEIRKSMGNETSKLDRWEMIEWFMTDAHKIKLLHENPSKHSI
jgi:hypothetical protein